MNEKQAYIFFISDSQEERWHRNREISVFYLNGITVGEEDQCEVLAIQNDNNFSSVDSKIEWILDSHQAQVPKVSFKMGKYPE